MDLNQSDVNNDNLSLISNNTFTNSNSSNNSVNSNNDNNNNNLSIDIDSDSNIIESTSDSNYYAVGDMAINNSEDELGNNNNNNNINININNNNNMSGNNSYINDGINSGAMGYENEYTIENNSDKIGNYSDGTYSQNDLLNLEDRIADDDDDVDDDGDSECDDDESTLDLISDVKKQADFAINSAREEIDFLIGHLRMKEGQIIEAIKGVRDHLILNSQIIDLRKVTPATWPEIAVRYKKFGEEDSVLPSNEEITIDIFKLSNLSEARGSGNILRFVIEDEEDEEEEDEEEEEVAGDVFERHVNSADDMMILGGGEVDSEEESEEESDHIGEDNEVDVDLGVDLDDGRQYSESSFNGNYNNDDILTDNNEGEEEEEGESFDDIDNENVNNDDENSIVMSEDDNDISDDDSNVLNNEDTVMSDIDVMSDEDNDISDEDIVLSDEDNENEAEIGDEEREIMDAERDSHRSSEDDIGEENRIDIEKESEVGEDNIDDEGDDGARSSIEVESADQIDEIAVRNSDSQGDIRGSDDDDDDDNVSRIDDSDAYGSSLEPHFSESDVSLNVQISREFLDSDGNHNEHRSSNQRQNSGLDTISMDTILSTNTLEGEDSDYADDQRPYPMYTFSEHFSSPRGMTVDPVRRRLFVADNNKKSVVVFNISKKKIEYQCHLHWEAKWNFPQDVTADWEDSRIYVSDGSRIIIYDSSNDDFNIVAILEEVDDATDTDDNDNIDKDVTKTKASLGLNMILGIAVDTLKKQIYVAEYLKSEIHVYNILGGKFELNSTFGHLGTERDMFRYPLGLCIDSDHGLLFVSDSDNHRIQVFSLPSYHNGDDSIKCVNVIGKRGDKPLEFNTPVDSVYDRNTRRLYVTDSSNNRVSIFEHDDNVDEGLDGHFTLVETLGRLGSENDHFNRPQGIAIDTVTGRIFVADPVNKRVCVWAV
eukprot:Awhi_evm1s11036